MARAPLLRQLTRMFRLHREARRRGLPAAELAELGRARSGPSRRRVLELGATAAALVPATAWLGGCGDELRPGPTVAIVGGGMAGLHCAHRLRAAGVRAEVYEAASRFGGRMFTDRTTFPDGMHCELGGELIDTGHATMRDLADELGLPLLDYHDDDPALTDLVAHIGGVNLSASQILDGFGPIAAAIDAALATLTDQSDLWVYYDNHNGGEALDALSIAGWLDSVGASGPVRTLLEVAYNIEYGLEVDVSNALNLLFLISSDASSFAVFGDSDERFHTRDGNDGYVTALVDRLAEDQLHLEAPLVALADRPDGRYRVSLGGGRELVADHVVLALPFRILRELDLAVDLPAVKRDAIAKLGYGSNAKLMCGFSSRPWRGLGSNGESFADLRYQSTWETSRLQPGASGILTNFTGGKNGLAIGQGTPAERLSDFLTDLDEVYPGASAASNGKVARMHWPTQRFTKASYSAYEVGQYGTISGAEIERVGNLHFCGEHTSLDAQGYMEGAALTGAMAAAEVLADLGATPRLAHPAARRIAARAQATAALRRWRRAA